eukprot:CAMPEP_0202476872 /NCGR_PEP_ID=MMETSP1360-20130828/93646_1 /ASSEMBLY_ACC=CAM_ASM_000848 /TAXON_ID=515479 /ORGANISM="Licmophora paradoxa, Strain CCMP2313" /LENGTH=154 /DNA_ID=CAMNT_0049104089 /DNA_START=12 /DNA_END=476 /DNA_ORIENTATION=+
MTSTIWKSSSLWMMNRASTTSTTTTPSMGLMSLVSRHSKIASSQAPTTLLFGQHHHPQQRRWNWQVYVRQYVDPKTKKIVREDPMKGMIGAKIDGDPHLANLLEYEKPWMKRKRLKNQRIFNRKKARVDEMIGYIEYMNSNKNKNKSDHGGRKN